MYSLILLAVKTILMAEYNNNTVGKISERGLLNNLEKKGFTPEKCLSELVANSVEPTVGATRVHFDCNHIYNDENYILMMDNGNGIANVSNMFNIYNENHETDQSLGISGIGSKPATCILSMRTHVTIYTHNLNGDYIIIDIPWDAIFEQNKYSDMITWSFMNIEQHAYFTTTMLSVFTDTHGTMIRFQYNDTLFNVIKSNFVKEELAYIPIEDRLSIIYGRFTNIAFTASIQENITSSLDLYNYFGYTNDLYFTGISEYTVKVYAKDARLLDISTCKFVMMDKSDANKGIYFKTAGRGYSKEATNQYIPDIINGLVYIGEITLTAGMLLDEDYQVCAIKEIQGTQTEDDGKILHDFQQYDIDHGIMSLNEEKSKKSKKATPHEGGDVEMFGPEGTKARKEFMCKLRIIRNGQFIGVSNIKEQTISNARANAEAKNKLFHTRCELSYRTVSSQTNGMDKIFYIQENKNQYNENTLHPGLSRLVWHVKTLKHKEIWGYFKSLCIPIQVPSHMIEQHHDKPIEQSLEQHHDKPIEQSLEQHHDKPIEQSIEQHHDKPIEQSLEQHHDKPIEQHHDKPIEQPAQIITDNSVSRIIPVVHHTSHRVTVSCGIEILKSFQANIDVHDEILTDIICIYQSGCTRDQLMDILIFMSPSQKYNSLMRIISTSYKGQMHNSTFMRYGVELYNYSKTLVNV
jgi:hypothetical protein